MAELTGQTFAGYEILAKLGQGGMGAVYKAKQPVLNRLVALKVMTTELAADADFVARFKREANAAAALNHTNIVQVFSAGEFEKTHFIVMEFVNGLSLRDHITNHGRLDAREAIATTIYVAKALDYAWKKSQIIHRDIKPENIFLSNASEVKLGDLGLAKTVGTGTTNLTQTGVMMGSPHYISPEQARGLSDIDFRADIYSLGCTLYHMLTGRPPYTGTDPLVVINKHVNDPPPAIFKVWPQCPVPLGMLVGKMLAKDRNARPQSYEQLIADLLAVSEKLSAISNHSSAVSAQPVVAKNTARPATAPATVAPAPAAKARGGSRAMLYAAVGAAAIVMVAGAVWWLASRASADGFKPLFNGKDLTGWKANGSPAENWVVRDGALVITGVRAQLLTEETFDDFEFHCEYRIAEKSDGGVYLRGLYQIVLGCDVGEPPSTASSGAIHGFIAPSENAAKAADEWQTLDARFVGKQVTVIINGRRVIEDGEVTRPTLLSLRIPLDAPGPIMLHGHKGTCQYRNVRIKPLRTATGASPTKVATQPAEQQLVRVMEKLKELNPGFDGKETHKIEDQSVVELKVSAIGLTDISPVAALKQLRLFHCNANTRTRSALTDISPLRGLPLTSVELNETAVGDLSPLAGMSLINLHLHCPQVTDLSPVKGMPLKHFCCASTHVSDLSPLKSMHLDWIVCDASLFQSPKNVAVLQAMTTLKTICHKPAAEFWRQLKNNPSFTVSHPASEKGAADSDAPRPSAFLREVATLPAKTQIARVVAELKKLNPDFDEQETHVIKDGAVTELVLSPPATARIRNISPVRALANLQKLRCTGSRKFGGPSPLADLSPLAGLCLKDLNIYLTSVRDLSPLKGMPLESLRWDSCAVKDLSSLAGLPLKFFSCYDNSQLCDLSPLKGAPLTELICSFTAVDDLSPLRDSPLNRLDIANTRVRDLSVLRGKPITFLNCQKTPVSDFSPLKDIPISSLRCDFVPARDTAVLRSIKTLEAINAIPVAEFWKKVEAGEVPKAK